MTAVSNATVKGHFCELLVSNIIGYLAFYWIADPNQIQSFIPLKHTPLHTSLGEICLIVGEIEDLKKSTGGFGGKEIRNLEILYLNYNVLLTSPGKKTSFSAMR